MQILIDVFSDTSAACAALAKKDRILARAIDAVGEPYIRRRPGGFEALFRIIVEQQVSVPSAQAIWARCLENIEALEPRVIIRLGADELRRCGLSGPKTRYVLALADAVDTGAIDFDEIAEMNNSDAAAKLISLKGIGPWSAAIYLLFCEGRVDIWPPGDIALLGAYNAARSSGAPATMASLDKKSEKWAPNRGVAAHILWTFYAHIRGRKPI